MKISDHDRVIFKNRIKQAQPNQIPKRSQGLPSSNSKKGKHGAQGVEYSKLRLNKHEIQIGLNEHDQIKPKKELWTAVK